MHKKRVTLNLAPYDVPQFDSIDEALTVLPAELILRWINTGWCNYQVISYVDNEREAWRDLEKKRGQVRG